MADASSSSVAVRSSYSRTSESASSESSEVSGRHKRRGSAPAASPSSGSSYGHSSPRTPRSIKRLSLTTPLTPLTLLNSAGTPEGSPTGSSKASTRPPTKLKHEPQILTQEIPAEELEKFGRYTRWALAALEERKDPSQSLSCLLSIGDAVKAKTGAAMDGWDGLTRSIRERIHAKPKGPNLISSRIQALDYYLWSCISALKLSTYLSLFFVKKSPTLTTTALGATYAILFPVTIHSVTMFREWLRTTSSSLKEHAKALDMMKSAERYVDVLGGKSRGKARVSDARAYRAFMAACNKVPDLSPGAALEARKTLSSAIRDCIILPGTVATSMAAQAAVISQAPLAYRGELMIGSGVCYLAQGVLDITQGWFAEAPRHAARADLAEKRKKRARDSDIDLVSDPAMHAANCTYLSHQSRFIWQQRYEQASGVVRAVKGACNLLVGATSLANGISQRGYGMDTGLASSLIGTAAAFNSMAYVLSTATKLFVRGNYSNNSKFRQRQAQMLIAMYSNADLQRAIEMKADLLLEIPKGKYEASEDGCFQTTNVKVAVRENEYVGLHLVATAISDLIDAGKPCDEAKVFECLRTVWNIGELNLQSMFLIAQATAPSRRLAFLKACLAHEFNIEFRLLDDKRYRERPLKASILVKFVIDLAKEQGWNTRFWKDKKMYPVLKERVLDKAGRDAFIAAVDKINVKRVIPRGAREDVTFSFVMKAAQAARRARADDLDDIKYMNRTDKKSLMNHCSLSKDNIDNFLALVAKYSEIRIPKFDWNKAGQDMSERTNHVALQKKSADDRAAILLEFESDPVVAAIFGNPAVLQKLVCASPLRGLLDQLDRRVSNAKGRDSDSESSVGSVSEDDDSEVSSPSNSSDDEESSMETQAHTRKSTGQSKKSRAKMLGRPNQNVDGNEESSPYLDSGNEDENNGTEKRTKKTDRRRVSIGLKEDAGRLDSNDDNPSVVIKIEPSTKSARRRENLRTRTNRAKRLESAKGIVPRLPAGGDNPSNVGDNVY
jgi:hypothetical protein